MNEIKTHDTMSPEAQRIAIAEACGFINARMWSESCIASMGINAESEYWGSLGVPDYLNDLNACHEFEKILPNSLTQKYWWSLCDVTGLDQYEACRDPLLTVSATAAQRCEAFLRTIGNWTND